MQVGAIAIVAVVGDASASPIAEKMAFSVGNEIATRQFHLLTGGGDGVMGAACKGFRFARNELAMNRVVSIGVLPKADRRGANEYLDIALPTGVGIARNALIARMADGVIAVGGGSGTLSEISLAWQMGKPIAALSSSGGWAERLGGVQLDSRRDDEVLACQSPAEALDYLVRCFHGGGGPFCSD